MKRSGREEKKEVKRLPVAAGAGAAAAGDYIGSTLEMEVTLLLLPVPGCCCSEKEERLAPPKLAPRCTGRSARNRGITDVFHVNTVLLA